MSIEVWESTTDGAPLALMESPDPDAPPPAATPEPAADAPPAQAPAGEALPADELRAIRRLIEEQRAEGARRETQVQTLERLVRGEDLTPPTSTQPAEPVRPRSEDFQSHEEYVEAVADFKASEKVAAFRQEQQQERQQTQQRQQLLSRDQSVKQQEDAFVADHPDYVDVVTKGLVAKAPPEFRQLIMLLDDAPAVAYQVAQDEALLGRLLQMPPGPLFYALGRLSASAGGGVSAPTATETTDPPEGGDTRTTLDTGGAPPSPGSPPAPSPPAGRRLPAPPRPLGGGGASGPGGYREDFTTEEYKNWRKGTSALPAWRDR